MKRTLDVMTCDRCKSIEEIRRPEQIYAWGKIAYREINGPRWVADAPGKTTAERADICPSCLKELHQWWESSLTKEPNHG